MITELILSLNLITSNPQMMNSHYESVEYKFTEMYVDLDMNFDFDNNLFLSIDSTASNSHQLCELQFGWRGLYIFGKVNNERYVDYSDWMTIQNAEAGFGGKLSYEVLKGLNIFGSASFSYQYFDNLTMNAYSRTSNYSSIFNQTFKINMTFGANYILSRNHFNWEVYITGAIDSYQSKIPNLLQFNPISINNTFDAGTRISFYKFGIEFSYYHNCWHPETTWANESIYMNEFNDGFKIGTFVRF